MVCKDEVCLWFKDNEPHRRLELLCGLLNMCLPLELRFVASCVEDLAKRDSHDLREAHYKANNLHEVAKLENLLDERTRSKAIVFIALLTARNHTCSSRLFQAVAGAQQGPGLQGPGLQGPRGDEGRAARAEGEAEARPADPEADVAEAPQVPQVPQVPEPPGPPQGPERPGGAQGPAAYDADYVKEMLLIYTMVLHHPAFTFEQKRIIAELHTATLRLEEQLCQVLSQSCATAAEVRSGARGCAGRGVGGRGRAGVPSGGPAWAVRSRGEGVADAQGRVRVCAGAWRRERRVKVQAEWS